MEYALSCKAWVIEGFPLPKFDINGKRLAFASYPSLSIVRKNE